MFDKSWRTPHTDLSVCVGDKSTQMRIWLVNSCKRCGDDESQEHGKSIRKDNVEIQTEDQTKWRDAVEAAENDDKIRIAVMHHSPVPTNSAPNKRDVFINNRDFNDTLIHTNVKLVLSGHHHIGDELYAAMPNRANLKVQGTREPMLANALVESGFLSLSAPTFLRKTTTAGVTQGFNIIEVEVDGLSNIASITVTKYRFTLDNHDHTFNPIGRPLTYRVALNRLQDVFPDHKEQERRLAVLSNVTRVLYSTYTPIEPMERILRIESSPSTNSHIDSFVEDVRQNPENIYGIYSLAVLSPAAWWAKELTRKFRSTFLKYINEGIRRGTAKEPESGAGSIPAFFEFSSSLYTAIQSSLTNASALQVAQRTLEKMNDDVFNHEEIVCINTILGDKRRKHEGSISKWGRQLNLKTYDSDIGGNLGGTVKTICERGNWDIPVRYNNEITKPKRNDFEMGRIVYWSLEEFDTDYALRVIEFHEDFHVPLFWLSPRHVIGRTGEARPMIGTMALCEHETRLSVPKWAWNDIQGNSIQTHRSIDTLWGKDAFPTSVRDALDSGTAEMRALFRRPDILFASDVWALRKMKLTDLIERHLLDTKEACEKWLKFEES